MHSFARLCDLIFFIKFKIFFNFAFFLEIFAKLAKFLKIFAVFGKILANF